MQAIIIILISIVSFIAAFRFYSKYISKKILLIDPDTPTPAHLYKDGVDYVPSNRYVLFGHHFASIAGLSPILGPAIAVIWGWLPALIWIILGSIFAGAVHDFTALEISVRHKGRSIGLIAGDYLGPRARILFLLIIFFLLALAMGVFVFIISILFSEAAGGVRMYPEAVIPTAALMIIAVAVGLLVYKYKANLLYVSILAVLLSLFSIAIGIKYPIDFISRDHWGYILIVYAFIASVLPVWILLQPRDYINSFQLYLGMLLLTIGIFTTRPEMSFPAVNHAATDLPSIFPFLFITVACGAISGFHNLVSSGTTARQLDKMNDARVIGYGGMLAEGMLGVLAVVAAVIGITYNQGLAEAYTSYGAANKLGIKLNVFIEGAAYSMTGIGIPHKFGATLISVIIVAFGMTTLDSGTRLLRFNFRKHGKNTKFETS